jgi:L-alanine-DL-glutamate epimerase-like enolase superfamily enzyme
MKIAKVTASVHVFDTVLPIVGKPAGDAVRVICEVETNDGHVGIGMASRFLPHAVAAAVVHHLGPVVIGMDPRDLERIHSKLQGLTSERGQTLGVNMSALSCIDLALWDIHGKLSGRTVAQLLGGHSDYAEAYCTFGFGVFDRDQLVEVARDLQTKGHRRFKMLVGVAKEGIHEDAARVQHVRDALGPETALAIDANESLSLDKAIRLAKMVEDCDISWFEDPVLRNDPRDLGLLRKRTTIPLSAGQMDGHSDRFRAFIEHDSIDIFMPNSLYNGGMTETRRVAHLAQIYNRPLSDAGGGGIFCLHHVAGFRNGTLSESHLGVDQVERQIFKSTPEIDDGRIAVPDAPGFGVELDRDAMRETLIAE